MDHTLKIALVTGGFSSESVISLKSAVQVKKILGAKYDVYTVNISKDQWEVCFDDACNLVIDKSDFSFKSQGQKIQFDLAVILIHGTPGEDGKIQAYFDLIGLPYTGCDVLCSALTFNKFSTKLVLQNYGIQMANAYLLRNDSKIDTDAIIRQLGLPCFVKPNEAGSSFGISKVNTKEELLPAIKKAFEEDTSEVLVESFVDGKEITCGLLKTSRSETILPLTEIVSKTTFFDYEAKYNPEKAEEITPARIRSELTKKCQSLSSKIYDYLNCKGLVRMDFILKNNDFYFLEVNTIPGMSAESIVPKMAESAKIPLLDLYIDMIEDARVN